MSTVQMSSGLRLPLLMPVGVQSTRSAPMRYEWLPSLPAQNPFCQIRRPMSHICSLSLNSGIRVAPLLPFPPYAMTDSLSNPVTDHRGVQYRGVVRVKRDALLREKRATRLATLGERDQIAVVGAEVVVNDRGVRALSLLAGECKPVLHLDDEEPSADERFVRLRETHAAHDLAYAHEDNS